MNRETRILLALLQMKVDRGCTPEEAANARAKAEAIATRLGVNLQAFEALHAPDLSGTRWWESAERKSAERQARWAAEREQHERDKARYEAEMAAERKAAADAAQAASEALLRAQPSMQRLVDLISHGGLTGAELARRMGLAPHTVRAMVSRLRGAGVKIETVSTAWSNQKVYRYR